MILEHYKLSTLITLLILSLLLPFGCFVIIFSYLSASEQLVDSFEKNFHERLSNYAIDIERFGRNGQLESVDRLISMAASHDNLVHLSLIDAQARVHYSTRYEWIGVNPSSVLPAFSLQHFKKVLGTEKTIFIRDEAFNDIEAYYPVDFMLSDLSGEHQTFVLYGEYSHRVESGQLLAHELKSLSFFIVGLLVTAFLIVYIMNHWLRRPLDEISHYIHSIEEGGGTTKVLEINSTKDVSHLAKALSSMNLELQRSQAELKDSAALIRNVINSVPDLIFYKDLKGQYIGCNQAFCQFVGKASPEEVVGKNDDELFTQDVAGFFKQRDKKVFRSIEPKHNEEWVTYPDGREVLLDTLKTPYFDDRGTVVGLIGISRDITVAKKIEEELYQAQKMESLGTLVGGIAHDFNNTLAGITGNTYLATIKTGKKDCMGVKNHLARIDKLSHHAAGIVSQLLSFAQKGIVQKKHVSLSELVSGAIEMTAISLPTHIDFKMDIKAEKLMVHADASQIQQVLINLLDNAKDAVAQTDKACISVSLSSFEPTDDFFVAHPEASPGSYAKLSVTDNGQGISPEHLSSIYEPFFTTKAVNEGTGLGLSMVLGAVQTHSAIIEVESELNHGTSFFVYFPLIENAMATEEIPTITSATKQSFVVLFADDEEDFRIATAEIIESFGHTVIQARDGQEAFSLFQENKDSIGLVILDVVMPHSGGEMLAKTMRALKPNLPVILITGYDADQVTSESKLDNSAVFTKPAPIEKLMRKINDFGLQQDVS